MRIIALFGPALLVLSVALWLPTDEHFRIQPRETGQPDLEPINPDTPAFVTGKMFAGQYLAGDRTFIRDDGLLKAEDLNLPRPVGLTEWGVPGRISIVAFPWEPVKHGESRGIALRLVNRTDAPVHFGVCDFRLNIVQEALDANGRWQPIEYHATSWCGNSYFGVSLALGEYWAISAPAYEGIFETKIRFCLRLNGVGPAGEEFYSNEFPSRIHPGQFIAPTNTQWGNWGK